MKPVVDWQVLQRMLEEAARHYSQPEEDGEGTGAGVDTVGQPRPADKSIALSAVHEQ